MPVLHLQRLQRSLSSPTLVLVLCDDPLARIDIPVFVHDHGHELVQVCEEASWLCFEIMLRGSCDASLA